mgnify:CR=1 FL=1
MDIHKVNIKYNKKDHTYQKNYNPFLVEDFRV